MKQNENRREQEKIRKEQRETLRLSPQEFIERYRKEQSKEKEEHGEKQWTNAIGGGMLPDVDLVGRVCRFFSRDTEENDSRNA